MAAEIKDLDMGDGMQCMNHPYTKNPGGICAFCLQEKLGKLVSSSFPLPKQVPSSSSSSPSLRSDSVGSNNTSVAAGNLSSASLSLSLSVAKSANSNGNEGYFYNKNHGRTSRLPFLLAKKKKKIMGAAAASSAADLTAGIVFKRSKSTTTPRTAFTEDFSPRKRGGFWSFLHISSSKHHSNATRKPERIRERMTQNESGSSKDDKFRAKTGQNEDQSSKDDKFCARTSQNQSSSFKEEKFGAGTSQSGNGSSSSSSSSTATATATTTITATADASFPKKATSRMNGFNVIVEEDGNPNVVVAEAGNRSSSSFDRKVSRSRSVGCGSRSFSGDFFERISNGFGDCTLRRVESHREGKTKLSNHNVGSSSGMRDMVRCGGIFSGFMIMTSSSSSSSSSATWVSSSSSTDHHHRLNGIKQGSSAQGSKNRSWGWTFASPMRAFSSTTNTATNKYFASSASKDGNPVRIITESSNKNTTPKLDAIPSLLAIRS